MILPIRTDAPLRSNPYANWALIIANVVVFIAQLRAPWITDRLHLDPSQPQLIQFVTYQFLHGGVGHLLSNMLFLYIFGNNVNDRMGNWAYLAFYLAGGVFAGVAYMFFKVPHPMIGASGSVSAVTGAFLVLLPRTHVTILWFFILIGLFEIPSLWLILAYFLMDVGRQFVPALGGDAVAYGAHIGGSIFGASICLGLLALRLLPRDMFDVLALIERWNRRRQYRDVASSGFEPFAVASQRLRSRPDPRMDQTQELRASISEAIAHSRIADAATQYVSLLSIDAQQVLSRQNQLDVANELFGRSDYANAAAAYEAYLRQYARVESAEQIQLMLGLIYARYVPKPDRAKELLTAAMGKLTGLCEIEIAREELARVS